MLNVQSGDISVGAGSAPAGASQSLNLSPPAPSSSAMRGQDMAIDAKVSRVDSSTKTNLAPQSAIIAARLAGVDEGASGATAIPARRAPRKTARYSTEADAQVAIESRGAKVARCTLAGTRSICGSSSPD